MNKKSLYRLLGVFLALALSLSLMGMSPNGVRTTVYSVTNLNNSGAGSLRQAILNANSHAGADTITFSVSGTITLGSLLPAISDDLVMDGSGRNVTISGANSYRVLYINSGRTVTLDHLSIINGMADGVPSGGICGGGIYNDGGTLTVRDSSFTRNSALYGGAIDNYGGTLTVMDSTFTSNTADNHGGAVYNDTGTLTVSGSTFISNSADYGGGIDNNLGTGTVVNSTFDSNLATTKGGGIYSNNNLTVTNSTLSGNSAPTHGAGIYNAGTSLSITNTIIANSGGVADCWSDIVFPSAMNSIIEYVIACGTPLTTADPQLEKLTQNGGSTLTFSLLPGSPAIDAGDDATCSGAPVNNLDQRGITRPYGAHCDIGSVEAQNIAGTLTTHSEGSYDGWILESGETTNVGGTLDSASTVFNLGDGAGDKQYRAVLSFNTGSLPNTAVITKATLKIKKQGGVGTNPFTLLGGLRADIRKPFFGSTLGLVLNDFQAGPGRSAVGTFNSTPVANWYSAVIGSAGYYYINKFGTTQFRLRFTADDNNDNAADYMKFFSGNYTYSASRPMLIIEYYIP